LLRELAKKHGQNAIIQVVQGIEGGDAASVMPEDR